MIPVPKKPAPAAHRDVQRRGKAWLAKHRTQRPPPYWKELRGPLAAAFGERCGYSAMYEPVGTIDHYLSIEGGHRRLAYAWTNLRFSSGWINSVKGTLDAQVLDPHEVQPGWFELLLPSLQLVLTAKVPPRMRAKAQFTLDRLQLGHGEAIVRQRQRWFELYREGKASLELLDEVAPLLAQAIRRAS